MAEEEPTWAVVLHALYENKMAGSDFDKYGYHRMSRNIAIADEVDRNQEEITLSLSQMSNQGLVNKPSRNTGKGYTLTEKGFDVAHTRDLRRQEQRREQKRDKRQHEVNRAIGFLTIGLLFTGLLQAWIAALIGKEAQVSFVIGTLLVGFIIVVGITVILWKSGMLAAWDSDAGGKRGDDKDENASEDEGQNTGDGNGNADNEKDEKEKE